MTESENGGGIRGGLTTDSGLQRPALARRDFLYSSGALGAALVASRAYRP